MVRWCCNQASRAGSGRAGLDLAQPEANWAVSVFRQAPFLYAGLAWFQCVGQA